MTMLQVTDECTINTNSGRFPQEGAETGCGQCTNKKENHGKIYSTVHNNKGGPFHTPFFQFLFLLCQDSVFIFKPFFFVNDSFPDNKQT